MFFRSHGDSAEWCSWDLVFNNLIVKFQVLCSALILLFLGNNGLSGTIPQQKAVYLKNMNLVASNFMFDGSNIWLSNGICCALTNITGNVLCACQYSPRIELFAEKFPLQ
ncbi:uncharacterized protein LOC123227530 isoform X3 [Mangifera indica]|uniref:uncharacterized protein LOC123227530 isoform X3 n=1 Tax=Mangifera indica TaxID=29780 RepID=UPI001CF988C0|nr:uncharacterized protein LOC123227530 isoform X3 [Mangifera indica]XP_044508449.1 uncharacterized protein LOC123227530 isoform X3 [Mangifera indica]